MIDVSPDLLAFLKQEYDRCTDTTLEDERVTAIDRYNGEPYGDEEAGRSQVVARDTAEVTDYMVISILRTLVSGDRVVEFVHKNSEAAHQATETIMHLFMDEQDGYLVLHDWLKAGLLEKNAVAMTYGEPQPPKRRTLEGVSALALAAQGVQPVEAEQTGEHPQEGPIFNAVVMEPQQPKFCDAAVPNEEFYCSPDARTITEAVLKGRRVRKSVSDLIELGVDREDAETIAAERGFSTLLSNARDEDRFTDMAARRGAARMVWWHEEYARFDANEDGIAELLYIRRTEDYKIFSVDEMEDADDHPFEDWSPFPMQHRRIGQSLADKVMDLERIRTVLFRQAIDGIYLSNNPSTYLHEASIGDNTIEDLLTVRAGRIVRWTGQVPPTERQGNFDPSAGFAMLEQMNGERESRTGITRLNQGLDADTLNKTATGTALMQAQGQQVEEYLARNFANALARLFTKKARLLKRHGGPIIVPIDGEYVEVDPRQWPEDMIARPRVGLGSGRKEQRMAYRRELVAMQGEAVAAGLPIVTPKNLYNSGKAFIADAGLGDVNEFFTDPDTVPQGQEKPDPAMMKVQMDAQAKQAEMQMKSQAQQANLQLKMMEIQGKLALEKEGSQARMMLEQQKAFVEAQLAAEQQRMEAALEQMKMQMQAHSQMRDEARKDGEAGARIHNMRAGGRLDK